MAGLIAALGLIVVFAAGCAPALRPTRQDVSTRPASPQQVIPEGAGAGSM